MNKGWAVSIDAEGDPPSLKPCFDGSEYQDGILYAYQAGTDVGGYQPQTDKGMLYRQAGWSSEPGYVYVNYRAGYETIPDDLAMIAGSLAMALLRDMATEPRLTSLRIGNVAEGYATGLGGLVEAYAPLLMKYRRLYY
ncbi:MAG: hypothetical protein FJW69_09645 [Actinobacteria bacterium]|nr:hypothetical protein [Actinomycetota bacterium]